jgi:hypothetical protein
MPGLEALANVGMLGCGNHYQAMEMNGTAYFPLNTPFPRNQNPTIFDVAGKPTSASNTYQAWLAYIATFSSAVYTGFQPEIEQMLLTSSKNLPALTAKDLLSHQTALVGRCDHTNKNEFSYQLPDGYRLGHARRYSVAVKGHPDNMNERVVGK